MGTLRRTRDGRQEVLSPESVVGRAEMSEIALDAGFVSARHALLRWTDTGWELRDLGSTNGTYVDGASVRAGPVRLRRGGLVRFGEPSETWELIDDSPPVPAAIPVQGGPPCQLVSGAIVIPNEQEPAATIFSHEGQWILETSDAKTALVPGQSFQVGDTSWLFHLPRGVAATQASPSKPFKMEECTLVLSVSNDEERVTLRVVHSQRSHSLGSRTSFYLVLVLARQRLADRALPPLQRGWLDVHELLRMIPDYNGENHLNVDVWRTRRALADLGMLDAASLFERRRGQLRLGTEHVEIQREGDSADYPLQSVRAQ
jgi:hypothetical protein